MEIFRDCKNSCKECTESCTHYITHNSEPEGPVMLFKGSDSIIYNIYQQYNEDLKDYMNEIKTISEQIPIKNDNKHVRYTSVIREEGKQAMGPDDYQLNKIYTTNNYLPDIQIVKW